MNNKEGRTIEENEELSKQVKILSELVENFEFQQQKNQLSSKENES